MSDRQSSPVEDDPYDEVAWMAIAIELVAVVAAFLFAILEAH
jgi:hypothetical protein